MEAQTPALQFNDGGALAGESTLVYNKTSNTLTVSNLTVSDTLTVATTTTLNSNTVTIGDAKIVLNELLWCRPNRERRV